MVELPETSLISHSLWTLCWLTYTSLRNVASSAISMFFKYHRTGSEKLGSFKNTSNLPWNLNLNHYKTLILGRRTLFSLDPSLTLEKPTYQILASYEA